MIDDQDIEQIITEFSYSHEELRQNQDLALAVGAKVLDRWIEKREKLKEEKLKHYSSRRLRTFYQIDIQHLQIDGESGEVDRYEFRCGNTQELMHGASVRVLIPPGQKDKDVITMLKKVVDQFPELGYDKPLTFSVGDDDPDDGIPF
jgi:hypothetical protein